MLGRLLEVLLIKALRSTTRTAPSPGLLRGWADPRLAVAIRRMHEPPDHGCTVAALASEAALSRSTFERFRRSVGVVPMEYLLTSPPPATSEHRRADTRTNTHGHEPFTHPATMG